MLLRLLLSFRCRRSGEQTLYLFINLAIKYSQIHAATFCGCPARGEQNGFWYFITPAAHVSSFGIVYLPE
jgi:hypothetical protein